MAMLDWPEDVKLLEPIVEEIDYNVEQSTRSALRSNSSERVIHRRSLASRATLPAVALESLMHCIPLRLPFNQRLIASESEQKQAPEPGVDDRYLIDIGWDRRLPWQAALVVDYSWFRGEPQESAERIGQAIYVAAGGWKRGILRLIQIATRRPFLQLVQLWQISNRLRQELVKVDQTPAHHIGIIGLGNPFQQMTYGTSMTSAQLMGEGRARPS
ncbi:hypothetical protein J5X84_41465 [Streptosporangiaceae bacterium NEAU-GS5]|nr:hypothetical protein [Streptosporangiaceae bacterium NEAU-GS5]